VQFRGWEEYQPITSLPAERNSVRIMSYNILAARYTTTDKYPHCPIAALSEAFRMTNIFQEVNNMQPDILVLQELSGEMFATGLGQRLREEAGYGGYHVPITSRGHEPCSARPEHEGVGIFFRASRFTALREIPISFNELAARDATLDQQFRTQLMLSSHNVASIVALKDHHTKAVVVVGGIHAYYDWTKPLCQLWQMRQLILAMQAVKASLENAGEAKVRVILCGDCNAEAQSLAIQYVLINRTKLAAPSTTANGSAGSFHSRPLCPTEEWTKSTLLSFDPHTLHLASAYEQYFAANEDHVTSIGGGFHGVIDYIFYDFDEWEPASVANVSNADVDIPNLSVPSDHFPLCATLIPKR
jgi:mRNA deadenylase 3'-5' endonuclease subunit Ccr4